MITKPLKLFPFILQTGMMECGPTLVGREDQRNKSSAVTSVWISSW